MLTLYNYYVIDGQPLVKPAKLFTNKISCPTIEMKLKVSGTIIINLGEKLANGL